MTPKKCVIWEGLLVLISAAGLPWYDYRFSEVLNGPPLPFHADPWPRQDGSRNPRP